jgi:anti-sigma B factor antagonist
MHHQLAADQSQRLTIDLTARLHGTVVKVAGELDHDTAPHLLHTFAEALAEHTGTIVVDCADIAFCDSSGLNTILRARRSAVGQGRALMLAAPSRAMTRLLRLTGADAAFDLKPTVEAALGPRPSGES